nr:MAG TPA: hypothetical protein [Caudoviricetes sp.]
MVLLCVACIKWRLQRHIKCLCFICQRHSVIFCCIVSFLRVCSH